jgi:hypothetical protein
MPAALAVDTPWQRCDPLRALRTRERMARRAGYLCYTAPPAILRDHGLGIYRMHACSQRWGSYFPLAERAGKRWHYDGEFQQLPGLAWDISAARVARREVGIGERGLATDDRERQRIYDRKELAAARLRAARRGER